MDFVTILGIAVVIYLVYVVVDKFDTTIENIVDIANEKAEFINDSQKVKYANKRAKLAKKLDKNAMSSKELRKLLKNKAKTKSDTVEE